jgi:hypothetical protein
MPPWRLRGGECMSAGRRTLVKLGVAVGAVVAAMAVAMPPASGAADLIPLPKADPPVLVSATVSGCEAPCAPGETGRVTLTIDRPAVPPNTLDGTFVAISVFADGKLVTRTPNIGGVNGDLLVRTWTICSGIRQPFEGCTHQSEVDAIRGAEEFSTTAQLVAWTDDPISPELIAAGPVSEPSNALVPTQL